VKIREGRFETAAVLLLALTACGGGGSATQTAASVLPVPAATAAPVTTSSAAGPVGYFPDNTGLSSAGSIAAGTQRAFVAVMSGASPSGSGFAPDTLVVGGSTTVQSTVRVPVGAGRAVRPSRLTPVEAFPADDSVLTSRVRTHASAATSARVRSQSVLPGSLSAGATAPIWVQQGSLSSTSRANVQVPATLLAQTAHGNIWIDQSLLSGASASTAFSAASLGSTVAQIGADFENAYASDAAHFASPDYPSNAPGLQPHYTSCGSDGSASGTASEYITEPADRRINVMIVNAQNLGGLGGYFSGVNFMQQSVLNCLKASYESNEAPFIFVGWFDRNGAAYELQEDLVRGTAHELQHLINFVNHAILPAGASSSSFNGMESTFVNEGLSELAQDLAVENMYGSRGIHFDADDALSRADAFLANPGNFSVSGFTGIDSQSWGGNGSPQFNCGGGCYGGAYLFQRYLRDRFGGDAYTHSIETSGTVGGQNLQSVTGENADALLDDFALAMAANTVGAASNDRRFTFGSLSLTGTYADQFGGSTTLGGAYATVLGSSAVSIQAPIGGFAFVSVPAVPLGGMPIQVTDKASVTGFGLEGGLAEH
jgi:hypothetical protein